MSGLKRCTVCGAPASESDAECAFCHTPFPRETAREERGLNPVAEANIITPEVIKKVQACVLKITTADSIGTGFVAPDGKIVSNAHVVLTQSNDLIDKLLFGGIFATFYGGDKKYKLRLLSVDEKEDVAVLEFAEQVDCKEYLTLADSDKVCMGEKIFTIGNPLGYEFSYAEARWAVLTESFSDRKNPVLQMQLAVNPGNSGGPVCNARGEVVGIATFFRFNRASWSNRIEKDDGISFAVTAHTIKEQIKKAERS